MNDKITYRVKTIRKALKIPQYKLSKLLKRNVNYVYLVERGDTHYTEEEFLKMYEHFQIKLGDIITSCNILRTDLEMDFRDLVDKAKFPLTL